MRIHMKKQILTTVVALVILLSVCISLASCSGIASNTENPVDFGAKYIRYGVDYDEYYVFNANGTGYCEYYHDYKSPVSDEYNYVISGRAEFEWRETANGYIYLFRTNTEYNDGHTDGRTVPLIGEEIFFADEFFVTKADGTNGSTVKKYVKEGSGLGKALEDAE